MKSYHEVEQDLLARIPNGLKFENYNHDHTMSLSDFIKNIFSLSGKYNTVTNNPIVNDVIANTWEQNRSLTDIFLLCRYYYPNISLKEVRETLLGLPQLVGWECPDVNRYVYNLVKLKGYWQDEIEYNMDEFGWYFHSKPQLK